MSSKRRTYLYVLDQIVPVDIGFAELLEAWEEDKMKPLWLVRKKLEEKLGKIEETVHYAAYFNPENMIAVIEYTVKCDKGTVGAKIVHAENPSKAVMEYYRAEKRGELRR